MSQLQERRTKRRFRGRVLKCSKAYPRRWYRVQTQTQPVVNCADYISLSLCFSCFQKEIIFIHHGKVEFYLIFSVINTRQNFYCSESNDLIINPCYQCENDRFLAKISNSEIIGIFILFHYFTRFGNTCT